MTNGEMMQKIFPNIIKYGNILIDDSGTLQKNILFDDTWWNAEYKELTPKNNLGVDCISREKVLKLIYDYKENHSNDREHYPINYGTLLDMIRWVRDLPSVTPQESFINKPCVSSGVCEHDKNKVFDKIYADIQGLRGCSCSCSDGIIDDVEDILDKYKAESEEI